MPSTTTHIRINRELKNTLKNKFPGVNESQLLTIMWDTSLLKLEGKFRDEKFLSNLKKKTNEQTY